MMNKKWKDLSLKKRLVLAFVGVVLFCAVLSAFIFTVYLVDTMKQSEREKIHETVKIAHSRATDITRGLEIYTDLISSDMTFGQVLSYDSSAGISEKIVEFQKLSLADVVAFVPKPQQYVQIKNKVFVNQGRKKIMLDLRKRVKDFNFFKDSKSRGEKGWISMGGDLYLFAAKTVLHFGTNMGVIFLAKKAGNELAQDISSATSTGVVIFDEEKVFGNYFQHNPERLQQLPNMRLYGAPGKSEQLVEDYPIFGQRFFSLFVPIVNVSNIPIATLALMVSMQTIRQAQNNTLKRVFLVAAFSALLSAFIGLILARAISNPIQKITEGILQITERGDLSMRIPGEFKAEIGILTSSFNRLLGHLQEANEKLAASEHRMKQELTMASTVQEMLFPQSIVCFENLELASFIDTSTETGGDWYGYAQDERQQQVSVLIGDVTGHGMPAALITAITNGFFRGVRESQDSIRQALGVLETNSLLSKTSIHKEHSNRDACMIPTHQMLSILNQILLESTQGRLQMTFFASVYDKEKKLLRYSNAGHNRPFICKKNERDNYSLSILPSRPSQRLGEFPDVEFEEQYIQLCSGDIVLWYTDGLLECENTNNEPFGKRRLWVTLQKYAQGSAEEINHHVISEAYRFYGNMSRKDDITLVVGKIV